MSTLSELFARDPLEMSKTDIAELIDYYRKARLQYNLGVKSAGSSKGIDKAAEKKKVSVDLDSLFS